MDLSILKARLVALGFQPTEGSGPNAIVFMFEAGSYYLDVDPNDKAYVRVGFPSFLTFTPFDQQRILTAANKITESVKAVKVYSIGNSVYCSVEQFLENEDEVMKFFVRYLRSIQGAVKAFSEQVAKGF